MTFLVVFKDRSTIDLCNLLTKIYVKKGSRNDKVFKCKSD